MTANGKAKLVVPVAKLQSLTLNGRDVLIDAKMTNGRDTDFVKPDKQPGKPYGYFTVPESVIR